MSECPVCGKDVLYTSGRDDEKGTIILVHEVNQKPAFNEIVDSCKADLAEWEDSSNDSNSGGSE